ncbi:MAG: protein kinase [candidate division Zixibacteria bacterium]|nr:protein kinase [candidate division Zixibacteria bacterium]
MIGRAFSHYKILKKIGEGGMGVVYKAEDTRLKRMVALKFLHEQFASDNRAKARFFREARAASALNHQNITTIYEIDKFEGKYFISMEYIEGESIKGLIGQKALSVKKALNIATQVAEGLRNAHENGVIHRDIKSDNIMLTPDGIVKIADFGLAKLRDASVLTTQPSMMGTLPYVSPEQLQGITADERTDIFSFGVVLYEMVTGRLPFWSEYGEAIIYSILNEEPDPVTKLNREIPIELERIIKKALEKTPEFRYQSIVELLADLRKVDEEYETVARRKAPALPSLAVLYFDNLGESKEDDYFAAGMTEDIITDLSKIDKIKVLSRGDVLPYRGKTVSIKETGRKLNVDYMLEGSVRKAQKKLRITAQLIRVSDGFHVWAERFDRELEDVFEVQSDVSQKVAQALEIKLTRNQIQRIEKKPTISIKAYDYYLRGRDYYWRLGKEDLDFAIQMYKKALEVDPQYALAYAGLADAYVYRYEAYYDRSIQLLDEAEEASKRALALDYDLPDAHRALGRVYKERRNNQESISEFKKAIQLKPDYFEAYRALGWIYEEMKSYDEAIAYTEKALEIRPSDRESYLLLGIAHLDKKEYHQAEKMFFKGLEVAPDYGTAYYYVGNTYQKQGKFKQALEMYEKCIQVGGDPNVYLDMGWIYLLKKYFKKAITSFKKSIELGHFEFVANYYLGLIFKIQGKEKESMDHYELCIELSNKLLQHDPENPYVHSTLGLAYTALRQQEKGIEHGEHAASLDPENGAILYDQARIYALQSKPDKAIQTLEKALDKCLSPSHIEAKLDPHFKSLHTFTDFLKVIGK